MTDNEAFRFGTNHGDDSHCIFKHMLGSANTRDFHESCSGNSFERDKDRIRV